MGEYNELTKLLLALGHTVDNHPSWVRVASGCYDRSDPLKNIYGGFEYQRTYADKLVYKTGCGLFCMGERAMDVGTGGKDHSHENFNPVVSCPYRKKGCSQNFDKFLGESGGGLMYICWCEVHRTDEQYDYSRSIEAEWKKNEEERDRLYEELKQKHNGRICQNHCFWDERTQEWRFDYNPKRCENFCPRQYGFCTVLGKKLSNKKGNVFYDIQKDWDVELTNGEQIGLFDKDHKTEIIKGLKAFKTPVPMDVCEAYARMGAQDILSFYEMNHTYEKFWNKTLKYSILNVRAEVKETRDLLQDLEDIKNGITISHESDNIEAKKAAKRDRAAKAKEAKRKKFIRMIEKDGWESIEDVDRKSIRKVLEQAEITKANAEHHKPKKAERAEQMSLFDFMEGT